MNRWFVYFSIVAGLFLSTYGGHASYVVPDADVNAIKNGVISQRYHQVLASEGLDLAKVAKNFDNPAYAQQLVGGLDLVSRMYQTSPQAVAALADALQRASSYKYSKKEPADAERLGWSIEGYRNLLERSVLINLVGASEQGNFMVKGSLYRGSNNHIIMLVSAMVDFANREGIRITANAPANVAPVPAPLETVRKPNAIDGVTYVAQNVPEVGAALQNPDIARFVYGIASLFVKPSAMAPSSAIYNTPPASMTINGASAPAEADIAPVQQVLYQSAPPAENTDNMVPGISTINSFDDLGMSSFIDEQTGEVYWYTPDGNVYIEEKGKLYQIL